MLLGVFSNAPTTPIPRWPIASLAADGECLYLDRYLIVLRLLGQEGGIAGEELEHLLDPAAHFDGLVLAQGSSETSVNVLQFAAQCQQHLQPSQVEAELL